MTDEKKESIKCSAVLHPIQAGIAFFSTMGASIVANKTLDRYAKKGTLGNFIDPELGKFFNPAIKNGLKNLGKLKNISTIVLTAASIPITGILLNKMLPKLRRNVKKNKLSKNS